MIKIRKNPYMILGGSVLLQFCYGLAYVWSVFQPYVKKRFTMDTGSANMPFAILLACFSIGNVVGGLLQKKVRPMYIVAMGNLMMIIGLYMSAFIPLDKGYMLNVTYGILGGFGAGIAYNTTIAVVQKWFPEKRGMVTGILVCSTGSFGLIMNPIAQKGLSTYGYEEGTLFVASIMIVCLMIGTGFISNPTTEALGGKSLLKVNEEVNYSITEVLRMPQYYMITFSMMLAVPGYFLINPMLMTLGSQRGLSENIALIGVMIVAVMNTLGRLLAPWMSDKIGRKQMLIFLFSMNVLAVLAVSVLRDQSFIMAVALVGFTYGGFMGMYPTITADYFGSQNNGINYGAVMIGYGISSLICPYLVKAVQASMMGTVLSLIIAAGASVLGILLIILLRKPEAKVVLQSVS